MQWDLSRAGRLGASLAFAGFLAGCAGTGLDAFGLSDSTPPPPVQNPAVM